MTSRSSALSATFAVIGPVWSTVNSIDRIPVYGTSPYVGFIPQTPQYDDGMRMEPPWSPPMAISTSPAATRAALPDDDPPAEYPRLRGLCTGPVALVWLPPENEKYSQTDLPAISPPASRMRAAIV